MNYIPQYINNLKVKKKRKFKKHHVLIYLFNHDELHNTAAKADGVVKDLSVDYTEVENPEKDPQSTGETNYNSTSHEFREITQVLYHARWSP